MNKEMKKPFFAGFLDKQVDAQSSVEGGSSSTTTDLKLDAPTKPSCDMAQTMKYPSDGDDDIIGVPM